MNVVRLLKDAILKASPTVQDGGRCSCKQRYVDRHDDIIVVEEMIDLIQETKLWRYKY